MYIGEAGPCCPLAQPPPQPRRRWRRPWSAVAQLESDWEQPRQQQQLPRGGGDKGRRPSGWWSVGRSVGEPRRRRSHLRPSNAPGRSAAAEARRRADLGCSSRYDINRPSTRRAAENCYVMTGIYLVVEIKSRAIEEYRLSNRQPANKY